MGFAAIRAVLTSQRGSTAIHLDVLSFGVISPPLNFSFNERIGVISREFTNLLAKLSPDVTVIERVFLGKNADSAFKLGHARGVAVAAAMNCGSDIVEYAAKSVKKGVTGSGNATKDQVQAVLVSAFGLTFDVESASPMRADASDALALAYYHARNLEVADRMSRQPPQPGRPSGGRLPESQP